jgi:hypothetical protein
VARGGGMGIHEGDGGRTCEHQLAGLLADRDSTENTMECRHVSCADVIWRHLRGLRVGQDRMLARIYGKTALGAARLGGY